jgi:Ca3427-like PBP
MLMGADVRDESSAAFMWEYFTTKKHYDSGRLRHIGDIYTPYGHIIIG